MVKLKLFGRWDCEGIAVEDVGLKKYISLEPVLVPRSSGRGASSRFAKSKYHIVERLMNKIMVPGHRGKKHFKTSGHCTGKGAGVYKKMIKCLELIEKETKENPIKVLVKAVENAAPREEITTIEYGGARYPQSVDCSPQRRIDVVLRQFVQGAYAKSFGKKKSIESALAEEIIKASKFDQGSQAIAKKLETERQSESSR